STLLEFLKILLLLFGVEFGQSENSATGQSCVSGEDQILGLRATVFDDSVKCHSEFPITADGLLPYLELFAQPLGSRRLVRLLVPLARSEVRAGSLPFCIQVLLAPKIALCQWGEVPATELLFDDVRLHRISVVERLLDHRERIPLLAAVADSVVSGDEDIVALPDDQGIPTAFFGVHAPVQIGQLP